MIRPSSWRRQQRLSRSSRTPPQGKGRNCSCLAEPALFSPHCSHSLWAVLISTLRGESDWAQGVPWSQELVCTPSWVAAASHPGAVPAPPAWSEAGWLCLGRCWWPGCSFSRWVLSPRVWSHCVCVLNCVQLLATLWTIVHQALLPVGFFRQECWSGLPFPLPGDLLDPGIEPVSLMSPALASFTTVPPRVNMNSLLFSTRWNQQ